MLIITDCRLPTAVRDNLTKQGHRLIPLPPHPALPTPVASHPDMLIFFTKDALLTTESYRRIARDEIAFIASALELKVQTVAAELGNRYPYDVPLNAAPVGSLLFCHPEYTAAELLTRKAFRTVPVRQGYAKCATLPVGSSALITEDPSIARAARKNGIDVLQISQNAVKLSGYSTGFLGGAASFAPFGDCHEILFCGSLDTHPDAAAIRTFCTVRGYKAVSLSDAPLYDVGTMFVF